MTKLTLGLLQIEFLRPTDWRLRFKVGCETCMAVMRREEKDPDSGKVTAMRIDRLTWVAGWFADLPTLSVRLKIPNPIKKHQTRTFRPESLSEIRRRLGL